MAAKTPAQWKTLFENEPFHRENYYTGPLGPDYTPGGTCLRLWAPTAEAVTVTLYHKGDGGAVLGTKPLVRGAQGVWSVWLPGEQHGRYYTFAVTVDGITRETGDPYARAAGVNGVRSMIVDLAHTAPSGWERDVRPTIPPAQRAVWEVSVRDFSQDAASGVRPAWRGKYMAFTQQGTTLHGDGIHPTCLNYLKRLGVKYVQLMPIFDFHSRKRVEGQEKEIAISGDDVVIIEGLHGLNPLLTQRVGEDKVTRIFASVRSRFTDHDRVLLTPQDVRLMRRMVRDRSTRNTTPEQTMAMWDEVCEGESEYITPYRDSADFKLDTTLDYEPNIFHSYLLPFLENRSGIAPEHYRKLDELYQRLDEFFDINNTQAIPADSVVREFIGPRRESEQTE